LEALIDGASKLVITMENPIDTSGMNRATPQGRHLWYAIGAGGLLLVILGGLAAWLPWHRQVESITEIKRLGGRVETVPVGPDWLRSIVSDEAMAGYDHMSAVYLPNTEVTDAGLVHIKGLTDLETLILNNTQVTDAGLVHLKGLTNLRELDLNHTQVTDSGLVHLKGLHQLVVLELIGTEVNDAGLVHLNELTNLVVLCLGNTDVTDAGLVHLKSLTSLETLWLHYTYVTEAGRLDLRTSLPACGIAL
jgi:hypothetical protein